MSESRSCAVTINFGVPDDTANCLASLGKSTVPVQAVVVDNTPNDPELELSISPFPFVHLIRAQENLGFGRGNNLGIEWVLQQSDCEFVLILNNDATIKTDAIERMQAAMDAHPESAIVTARIVLAEDESLLWYGGGEFDWKRGAGIAPGMLGPANASTAMRARHVSFASGCTMLIRRSFLETHGGFDARFFMYEEDAELSLRANANGWKIWYEPMALIKHIGQGSQKNSKFYRRYDPANPSLCFFVYHGMKNTMLNASIHAKGLNRLKFWFIFPLFVAKNSVSWVASGRMDAIGALLKSIRDFKREK